MILILVIFYWMKIILNHLHILHMIFNKVDVCIRKYDETKYLALFHSMRECFIELDILLC